MGRRVELKKGKQRKLILMAVKKCGSLRNLANNLRVQYSTIKNYSSEGILFPEKLFERILDLVKVRRKDLNVVYLNENWGASVGGKAGIKALQRKYPKELVKWRRKGIKRFSHSNTKKICVPLLNEKLAELIGVYLGDGTMTKYFIRISGDYRYDLQYFEYLGNLVYELFRVESKITKDKRHNTIYLTVFSKNLCSFLNKNFSLKFGHKIRNKTTVPRQIMKDKKLAIACLRGLIDTDGSVSRRGRRGSQFCIQFTSHNKHLLHHAHKIGRELGIFTFLSNDRAGTNKRDNIVRYFDIVGSSNLRHIVRFHLKFFENKTIYRKDAVKYYQKDFYRSLELPFKIKAV